MPGQEWCPQGGAGYWKGVLGRVGELAKSSMMKMLYVSVFLISSNRFILFFI